MKNVFIIGIIISGMLFCHTAEAQSRRERKEARKAQKEAQQNASTRPTQETPVAVRPSATTPPAPQIEQTNSTLEDRNPQAPQRPVASSSRTPGSVTNINLEEIINNSRPVVTPVTNGSLNWSEQFIEATGSSVIDTEKFSNPAQARAMATRGAVVVAQRNLLEIINGVQVTSETTVRDMMAMGDFIYTRVDGVIKGAEMIGEPIEKDGMMEVRMRVPMYKRNGLAAALHEHVPVREDLRISTQIQEQLTPEVQNQLLHALALNLNGQQFDPALFPVIVDENNNLVLDLSKLYNPNTGTFPQILNTAENIFRELGIREGVEVIDILRTEPGKIVLDNANVRKINWDKIINTATSIGKFLMLFI